MMKKIFIALSTLAFASLACSIFIGGPSYPDTPIPISTEAAQNLQDQAKQAIADGAQTGTVTLQITENQLTSYLAFKLDSQANPLITDPQVQLRDGRMKVFGKAERGIFNANISIAMNISVDEQGKPKIEITQADFGPLPTPQGLNDAVSAVVGEAFTGSLGPVATGFRLESIAIADGTMTITGRVK
ncbi:MAG: LmeA family phospholipid-binding protein [Chloroflexi bacterium]|nr:LmeA family phospholipid-binding protein [Chloroflexota bacterium]